MNLHGEFGGAWKSGNKIVVGAKKGSAGSVLANLRKQGLATNVTVVTVPHSYDELLQTTMAIATDPQTNALGISTWGPDSASNMVVVHLQTYTPQGAADVLQHFGGDDVVVSDDSFPRASDGVSGTTNASYAATRATDFSPFYGGDGFWWPGVPVQPQCTSGIPVRGVAHPEFSYVISAGHCAPVGAHTTTDLTHRTAMGYVTNVRLGDGLLDNETIGGTTWLPLIWGGSPSGTAAYNVVGSRFSIKGDTVAVSGAGMGETRNNVVDAIDQCMNFKNGNVSRKTCWLTQIHNTGLFVNKIDEGGPVIQHSSADFNDVYAEGTIVGEGTLAGSEYVWYSQMQDINNYFNTYVDTNG